MSALRGWLPCFGWLLLAVGVVFIATLRMEPAATALALAVAAGAYVFLVHLPGFRSRPFVRAVGVPLVAGGVAAGAALGAHHLQWHDLRSTWRDGPAWWLLAALVLGPLLLRMLVPPGAGKRVLRLLAIEWTKLRKGWLLRVGLMLLVAVPLLVGTTHEPSGTESGWAVAALLLKSGTWMAEVLLLVLGAVAIAGEVGQGTMKMILPHAYKRSDWILAKGLLLSLVAIAFTLVIALTGAAYAEYTLGLEDVIKKGEPAFGVPDSEFQSAETMRSHLVDTTIASAASLIALAWLSLLFSALFSSVVPALSTAFLVFVALRFGDLLLGYSRSLQEKLFTSYPEWMREATRNLGRALNDRWEDSLLPECLWLCGITVLLAALASIAIFDRRELG